jgi:hypothetical protein
MMQNQYYRVLGVEPGCSMTEIKKAYRQKAKEYHPDLNHEAGAQEKFIEVNEAYEFFLTRSAKVHEPVTGRTFSTAEMQQMYEEWMRWERMKARARAAKAAKKKFEEFRNSPIYRTSNILSMGADYVWIFVGTMVMLGPIFGVYYRTQADGFVSPNGVFAAVMLMIVGLIIILFSASDIKRRKRL